MTYRLKTPKSIKTTMRALPGHIRQRANNLVKALANDPRPSEAEELRGKPGVYRIKLDKWRLIYRVDDDASLVIVFGVRRKTGPETYENLED